MTPELTGQNDEPRAVVITIQGFPPVDDAALVRLSDLNEGWSFERDDDGNILVAPNH